MARKIRLYNPVSREYVNVAPEEATDLLRKGLVLTKTDEVFNLRDQYGELYGAKGQDVYKALRNGHRFESTAEEDQRYLDENYGGVGSAVAAGAFSAVDTATFGAGSVVARAAGYREEVADLTRASPVASAIGTGVGIIAPALATGGTSVVAKALAATPTARLFKGTEKLAGTLAKGIAGADDMTKASIVLGRVGAEAVQGAVHGGTQAISEELLGNPNLTASKMLVHAAKGAALGATVDGLLGFAVGGLEARSIAKGAEKFAKQLTPTAQNFTEAQRELLEEEIGRSVTFVEGSKTASALKEYSAKVVSAISSRNDPRVKDNLVRLAKDNLFRQLSEVTDGAGRFAEKFAPDLGDLHKRTNAFIHGLDDMKLGKQARTGKLAKKAPDTPDLDAHEAFRGGTRQLRQHIMEMRARLDGRPGAEGALKDLDDIVAEKGLIGRIEEKFMKEAAELPEGRKIEAAFKHTDELYTLYRNKVNDLIRRDRWAKVSDDELDKMLQASPSVVRSRLVDTSLYGDAAKGVDELNHAAEALLKHSTVYDKLFSKAQTMPGTTRRPSGSVAYEVDINKAKTFGRNLAHGEDSIYVRGVKNTFDAQRRELEKIVEHLDLSDVEKETIEGLAKEWGVLQDRLKIWEEVIAAGQARQTVERIAGGAQSGVGAAQAGNVARSLVTHGAVLAAGTGTAPVGLAAAAYIGATGLSTLTSPVKFLARISQAHDISKRVTTSIKNAAAGIISRPVADGRIRLSRKVGHAARAGVARAVSSRSRDLEEYEQQREIVKNLSYMQHNPGPARQMLTERFPPQVRADMPKTVAAAVDAQLRAADYLSKKASELGLDNLRRIRPRPEVWARWKSIYRAVNNPIGEVIEPAQDGLVSKDGVEALKEVHPHLFMEWTQAIWDEIKTEQLHGPMARRLSIALDMPFDAFSAPDMVKMLQNTRSVMAPDGGGMGGSGRPPGASNPASASRLRDLQDHNLSPSQRLLA